MTKVKIEIYNQADTIQKVILIGHTRTDICTAITGMVEMTREALENLIAIKDFEAKTSIGFAVFIVNEIEHDSQLLLRSLTHSLTVIAEQNPESVEVVTIEHEEKGQD
ncbi:ribosomal-processing cysteine protease Prp [Pseudolactococcus reticulitermitis]|uniref:Ribosomal processing cysteine protease Prp n=1 Tax=Pseudolactococcus reticulitermitis TaxID=2025039 RepID=A0A224WWZ3_9LACT|nr:ribosomal-processing cysteine protease Prp [Lactococcus reticulitermitis]GAX46777.1 hypothetical protein RsY01_356 [Lactococcus reticulitermitis]